MSRLPFKPVMTGLAAAVAISLPLGLFASPDVIAAPHPAAFGVAADETALTAADIEAALDALQPNAAPAIMSSSKDYPDATCDLYDECLFLCSESNNCPSCKAWCDIMYGPPCF